ncbi:threonine/serine exporter family protein [Mammaliicoccus sciuri]|uniref:threonine/serine exporter family protein n=1 Tax=Mammaliicoccus sciuri TaxID=1296 RepID=UPI003A9314D9
MLTIILHFVFSFLASYLFALVYDAPRKLFLAAGFGGGCGYLVNYLLLESTNMDAIYTSLLGSLTLGLISHTRARTLKSPVIIFMIPGIIPLVPGGIAFEATRKLVELEFNSAVDIFIRALLIAGAIAVGLLIADQIFKIINHTKVNINRETGT